MTGDTEIRLKTGLEIKQEILSMIWDYAMQLRETKAMCPWSEYMKNTKIEALCEIHGKVLDVSPTKNGG